MAASLDISTDTVRNFVLYLRKWHALEGATGQNDGSNDTDDIHDDLEMHPGHLDRSDLEGMYYKLDINEKTDLSALILIGMEEEATLSDARTRIAREEVLSLDDLLEMPMAPEYLASALDRLSTQSGDNVYRLRPDQAGGEPGGS